jgi:hypothetical protein
VPAGVVSDEVDTVRLCAQVAVLFTVLAASTSSSSPGATSWPPLRVIVTLAPPLETDTVAGTPTWPVVRSVML